MRFRSAVAALFMCAFFSGCAGEDKPVPVLIRNSPPPVVISRKAETGAEEVHDDDGDHYDDGETRAVWLTYIELAEMLAGESSEEDFRRDIDGLFGELSELGINTVYAHVRAFGDAFYDSELFVQTKYLSFDCDLLEIMTESAHAHGLAIHAWVNPLRCDTGEYMPRMAGTTIGEWYSDPVGHPEYVVLPDGGDTYLLNPAVPEVRRLIADGVTELCDNYDIDGVHIDDYFYPTTDPAFDELTYAAADTDMTLEEWRTENCSRLVAEMYSAASAAGVPFSISPQGNIGNNYDALYADVRRWCSEDGFCDIMVPQIYFGYDNEVCPFTETLREWESMIGGGRKLVVGLGVYKTDEGGELSGGEYDGVIASQIEDVTAAPKCSGYALYSVTSFIDHAKS